MTIRFQADADLNRIIVLTAIRREPTLDFHTARAAGLTGLQDPEVLEVAAEEGRVLVSHDQKTCRDTLRILPLTPPALVFSSSHNIFQLLPLSRIFS